MRLYSLLILFLCITCLVIFSGCTGTNNGGTPPSTTARTTPQVTTTIPSGGGSLIPSATQTVPPGQEVTFEISRDQIFPTITVTFRGGKGQLLLRDIDVKVTRTDGIVKTAHLEPTAGTSAILEGTRGKDRVEVMVSFKDGGSYKVIDTLVDYYAHA